MIGWCGDKLEDVQPHIYADADFAGCTASQKSTNGVHHVLRGPNTCFPIEGISKRQSCVSTSTTEAEIVAGFFALKTVGLPALAMWEAVLPGPVTLTVHEDNQAMIRVCHTGKNPTMRYLGRVHRISIQWLYERFGEECVQLCYTDTKLMAADIYTKAFKDLAEFNHVRWLINHMDPKDFDAVISKDFRAVEVSSDIQARNVLVKKDGSTTPKDKLGISSGGDSHFGDDIESLIGAPATQCQDAEKPDQKDPYFLGNIIIIPLYISLRRMAPLVEAIPPESRLSRSPMH